MSGPSEGRRRRRPPWWPEGESWPPAGRRGFRPPRRLLLRFAPFLVLGVTGIAALSALGVLAAMAAAGVLPVARPVRFVAAAVVVVAAVLAVRWLSRLGAPLGVLIAGARKIEAGEYSTRLPEYGPRDLRSVVRAFNAMAARLQSDEDRRRSFLSDVAHEMRTPLSVIQGQAEAIADGVHPPDASHLAPILEATRLLERLVEDLRTLAQVESGVLQIVREPVDIGHLVEDATAAFQPQAAQAGIRLRTEVRDQPGSVNGDPARLHGVVANLVSNALRHTPRGGSVSVAVRRTGEEVVIEVSDDGEGIAPDLLPRVFDRFVRGPGSQGTGLGLAIVRDVVTAHSGTIAVESVQGSGTRFTARLRAGDG